MPPMTSTAVRHGTVVHTYGPTVTVYSPALLPIPYWGDAKADA